MIYTEQDKLFCFFKNCHHLKERNSLRKACCLTIIFINRSNKWIILFLTTDLIISKFIFFQIIPSALFQFALWHVYTFTLVLFSNPSHSLRKTFTTKHISVTNFNSNYVSLSLSLCNSGSLGKELLKVFSPNHVRELPASHIH